LRTYSLAVIFEKLLKTQGILTIRALLKGVENVAEHVLLVDDEDKVLEFMSSFLQREGFHIATARTGMEALAKARQTKPAVVVLDWMMPEMNGLDVCRELRKHSKVGIIMVTAKSDEVDKIIGLEAGADDYMVKPFSLRELLARIRAVIRRLHDNPAVEDHLVRGDLAISSSQYRVWKHGSEIEMTPTEFKLLLTLAAKPGIVYSRLQLLNAALDDDFINVERTVDAHISRLRKKIEDDITQPKYIQTVYGFGYRFGGTS
jgi:DNA-binding response OmpR family regulator